MRLFKVLAVALLIAVISGISFFIYSLQPKDSANDSKQDVVIHEKTSREQVSDALFTDGLIRSSAAFLLYARIIRLKVLPGTYELSPAMSGSVIADSVSSGKFKTAKITLPEGWRATDIEQYLVEEKHLTQLIGFAKVAEKSEGYLFPDTYQVKVDTTIPELVTLLKDNFKHRTEGMKITSETIILASIVEREAADDVDRGNIAQVYINRLARGMRLEADPTIQYAKGNWKAVTLAEYQSVESSYNTYLIDGLPPGAICNPGIKSIQAVLQPTPNGYFFFFHAKGQTYFSKTLEEHRAKINKYFN